MNIFLTSKCFVQKVPYDSLCNPTFSSLQKHPTIVFHHVHKIDMNCLEIYLYWSYTICSLSLCYLASSLNIVILRGLYISCLRYNKSIIINVICQNILWISSWRMSLMKSSYIYIFSFMIMPLQAVVFKQPPHLLNFSISTCPWQHLLLGSHDHKPIDHFLSSVHFPLNIPRVVTCP